MESGLVGSGAIVLAVHGRVDVGRKLICRAVVRTVEDRTIWILGDSSLSRAHRTVYGKTCIPGLGMAASPTIRTILGIRGTIVMETWID